MRTIQQAIYKFEELGTLAKEKAKTDYFSACGYCHEDEANASLEALAQHFGGHIDRQEVDYWGASFCSFNMPELTTKEIKERLGKLGSYNKRTGQGTGECVLTGVCFDEDAIDGFRLAWRGGERDLDRLMYAAFKSWLKSIQADVEYQNTDEAFQENSEANGYEYYEHGELVPHTVKARILK